MRNLPIIFLITIILILPFLSSFAQNSNWQLVGQMPIPTAGSDILVYDSLIYILGGLYDSSNVITESNLIQTFDPRTGQWDIAGNMLAKRHHFVSGIWNDQIFSTGGAFANPQSFYWFSLEKWDFTNPATFYNFNPEFNREYSTGLIHNENLYLIGGAPWTIIDSLNYIVEYNLPASAITFTYQDSLLPPPLMPYSQISARIGDIIYIIGGWRFGLTGFINKFNTVNHTYTQLGALNHPLIAAEAVNVGDDQIYIIGGIEDLQMPILKNVEILQIQPVGFTIQNGPDLNIGRMDLSAVNYFGDIYVFGGFDATYLPVSQIEMLPDPLSNIRHSKIAANSFKLYQNFPNPFNTTTIISFEVKRTSVIRIDIYSTLGRFTNTLINKKHLPGVYEVSWDGTDNTGKAVGSGLYFYKLSAESYSESKKMILVK